MRILVTGSRSWPDRNDVYRELNNTCAEFGLNFEPDEHGNTMPDPRKFTLVHGACPQGADLFADDWAVSAFFVPERHPAEWERYGKRAGFVRNAEMVNLGADLCLAFIHSNSRGASMTANLAERAGIRTRRITVN